MAYLLDWNLCKLSACTQNILFNSQSQFDERFNIWSNAYMNFKLIPVDPISYYKRVWIIIIVQCTQCVLHTRMAFRLYHSTMWSLGFGRVKLIDWEYCLNGFYCYWQNIYVNTFDIICVYQICQGFVSFFKHNKWHLQLSYISSVGIEKIVFVAITIAFEIEMHTRMEWKAFFYVCLMIPCFNLFHYHH